jgi:hypothetical protein
VAVKGDGVRDGGRALELPGVAEVEPVVGLLVLEAVDEDLLRRGGWRGGLGFRRKGPERAGAEIS